MNRQWIASLVVAALFAVVAWLSFAGGHTLNGVLGFFVALFHAGNAVGAYRRRTALPPPERALNPKRAKIFAIFAGLGVSVLLTLGAVLGSGVPWWWAALLAAPVALPVALMNWPRAAGRGA